MVDQEPNIFPYGKKTGGRGKSQECFIHQAQYMYGTFYDYSKTIYTNTRTPVIINCPNHGEFYKTPREHLRGYGCPNKIHNFLRKATSIHGDLYDYSLVEYLLSKLPVKIICPEHGVFKQTPGSHLQGCGCPDYSHRDFHTYDTHSFIEKSKRVHGEKYDYSQTVFVHCLKPVIIVCKRHGQFLQTPSSHYGGHGCHNCIHTISKPETEWLNYLGIKKEFRQRTIYLNGKKFSLDALDPYTNTIYEFYGDYWHGNPVIYDADDIHPIRQISFGELYAYTIAREQTLKEAGYNVVCIWENEFKTIKYNNFLIQMNI